MKFIVAIALAIASIFISTPAQAWDNSTDDSPGYVTFTEWQTEGRGTMSDIERSWGVVGIGSVISSQNGGKNIVKEYPYGKDFNCTGSTAQVVYNRNAVGQYMSSYMSLFIWQPDPLSKVVC